MKMRYLLSILLVLFCTTAHAQKADAIKCSVKLPLLQNDSVYIKGKRGKRMLNRKFFKRKFELAVSDNSYKIVGFYITWNDLRARIHKRGNRGPKVCPEIDAAKSEKENYSLKNLDSGVVIVFDCIVLKKGNEYFKSSPLVYDVAYK